MNQHRTYNRKTFVSFGIIALLLLCCAIPSNAFSSARDGSRHSAAKTSKKHFATKKSTSSLELHSFAAEQVIRQRRQKNTTSISSTSLAELSLQSTKPVATASGMLSPEEYQRRYALTSTGNVNSHEEAPTREQQASENQLVNASAASPSGFGKSVCIAVTGVDSRLGVGQRHADANHVLRIWLESGRIEIFSVPRGTQVDAGFSTPGLNYLANLRSNKGREVYLKKLAEITGVGRIDYWVELGFSQAIGLIEMLGLKDKATSTLHVLRTRKAFAIGDYQRCYNQGQFIRQQILNNFNKSTGFLGTVTLRAALGLVETNLTVDAATSIIDALERHHFPASADQVTVRLRPPYKAKLLDLNLSDATAITKLNSVLNTRLKKSGYISEHKAPAFNPQSYESRLRSRIETAERIAKKKPTAAIASLSQVYKQRAWLQIHDEFNRNALMKRVCDALSQAYEAQGFVIQADDIRSFCDQQLRGVDDRLGRSKE